MLILFRGIPKNLPISIGPVGFWVFLFPSPFPFRFPLPLPLHELGIPALSKKPRNLHNFSQIQQQRKVTALSTWGARGAHCPCQGNERETQLHMPWKPKSLSLSYPSTILVSGVILEFTHESTMETKPLKLRKKLIKCANMRNCC